MTGRKGKYFKQYKKDSIADVIDQIIHCICLPDLQFSFGILSEISISIKLHLSFTADKGVLF
jgi:hypothetical protein